MTAASSGPPPWFLSCSPSDCGQSVVRGGSVPSIAIAAADGGRALPPLEEERRHCRRKSVPAAGGRSSPLPEEDRPHCRREIVATSGISSSLLLEERSPPNASLSTCVSRVVRQQSGQSRLAHAVWSAYKLLLFTCLIISRGFFTSSLRPASSSWDYAVRD